MKRLTVETAVGIFILIGIVCVGYLTIKLGKMELVGGDNYSLYKARFQSVAGLKKGAGVHMAGVEIGTVLSVSLDVEDFAALIEMRIRKDIALTEDVIASIKTSGLIGDKYIKLTPGGSEDIISPGGFIMETESALDIEELVSKYVFGGV